MRRALQSRPRRSLLHLLPTTARLLAFSLRNRAFEGFRDWNLTYERVFEYGEAFSHVRAERPASVLDVAGDISIFGCFIADAVRCSVDIVDMSDLAYCAGLHARMDPEAAELISLIPGTRAEELSLKRAYDLVLCISAIEHFDGDSDLRFMEAASNLLTPGGLLVVTAPFTPGSETERKFRERTYYDVQGQAQQVEGFYMRHYSREGIKRLAERSGLAVERILYAGEILNFYDRVFLYGPRDDGTRRDRLRSLASRAIGALSPLYPFLFMREATDPGEFRCSERRRRIYNPDTFLLALRKPLR